MSRENQITEKQPVCTIYNESGYQIPVSGADAEELCTLISREEARDFEMIEVVYVDEEHILETNRTYLDHDYVTDIITFPYQKSGADKLEGTLFCCAQRIAEQAEELGETIENEFRRVFIHGLLHLIGYNDKTDEERMIMRKRENFYLNAYNDRHAK